MDKNELLQLLEEGREEIAGMLEDLSDETMTEKGVIGEWSIKDILAHLVYWEGQTVTLLFQVKQGVKRPTTVHFGSESVDAINQRSYELSQARPLENIWNDFMGVRKQTMRRVSEFNDEELNDGKRYPWMNGVPLIELIISDTIEHENEHAEEIQEWLNKREARQNGSGKHA